MGDPVVPRYHLTYQPNAVMFPLTPWQQSLTSWLPAGVRRKDMGKELRALLRQLSTKASGCQARPGVQAEVCRCIGPGMWHQVYIGMQVFFHRSVLSLQIKVKQKLKLAEDRCVSPGIQSAEAGQVCKTRVAALLKSDHTPPTRVKGLGQGPPVIVMGLRSKLPL